ncbi:hypothetical protein BJF78_32905 [Pseudonocardia sp. CNS-139]|nr:hypothetical protein BJF78_32905 [Pseudonocardia sp. CNS-139]
MRWRTLEQLTGQMLEAATLLGLPETRIGIAQQSGQSLPDLVWGHLERTGRWVIVVDNLDEPADAAPAGEQLREYRSWIRPTGAGLLVVTSRDRDPHTWGPSAELFPLDPLDAATAPRSSATPPPRPGTGPRSSPPASAASRSPCTPPRRRSAPRRAASRPSPPTRPPSPRCCCPSAPTPPTPTSSGGWSGTRGSCRWTSSPPRATPPPDRSCGCWPCSRRPRSRGA